MDSVSRDLLHQPDAQARALAYASGWCSRKPSLTRRVGAAESPRLRVGLVQPKALAYASGWCSRKPSLTRRVGAAESPRLRVELVQRIGDINRHAFSSSRLANGRRAYTVESRRMEYSRSFSNALASSATACFE